MSNATHIETLAMRQGGARVAIPVVHHCGKSLPCDGNLPVSLTRLIPPAWGNAQASAWQPFVDRAIVLGRL